MAVMRERLWREIGSGVPSDAEVIHALRRLKHVLLCGQSTRIPSLARTIGSLTPAPVISEFQNDAVVRGLSYQLGILRGFRKDQLLLDNMQQGIGVLVASTATKEAGPRLAYLDEANTHVLTLVDKGTTIPTKRSEVLHLEEHAADRTYRLRVVELKSPWPDRGRRMPLGIIEFRSPAGDTVEVTLDVDANSVMLLTVTDRGSGKTRTVVLNRPTYPDTESIVDQRLTGTLDEASPPSGAGTGDVPR
jgi:molecular chaperone DnaK (HSP70)